MSVAAFPETHVKAHTKCNELVRENAAGKFGELPFICECEDATCCVTVWMTAAEYDGARSYALPILAPHHWAYEAA